MDPGFHPLRCSDPENPLDPCRVFPTGSRSPGFNRVSPRSAPRTDEMPFPPADVPGDADPGRCRSTRSATRRKPGQTEPAGCTPNSDLASRPPMSPRKNRSNPCSHFRRRQPVWRRCLRSVKNLGLALGVGIVCRGCGLTCPPQESGADKTRGRCRREGAEHGVQRFHSHHRRRFGGQQSAGGIGLTNSSSQHTCGISR